MRFWEKVGPQLREMWKNFMEEGMLFGHKLGTFLTIQLFNHTFDTL